MEYITSLKKLLSISSKTTDDQAVPNKAGVNKASEYIKELLSELPLKWTEMQKANAATFYIAESLEQDSSTPRILISTHVDTVFKAEDIEVKADDTKIYGSGAQDMKANIIVAVETLKLLHKQNRLKNIALYLCPEEETGTEIYQDEIRNLAKKADYVFVMESTLDLEVDAPVTKRSIVISRKGFKMYDFIIKGPGGHSGVILDKKNRHSTVILASEIIKELEKLEDYENETTFNPGFIKGGQAINVLATETYISFEFRFRKNSELERILESVGELIQKYNKSPYTIEVIEPYTYPPFEINDSEAKFVQLCHEAASDLGIELIEEKRGGGSEACIIKDANPKAAVLDAFGVRGAGQHTLNEWVYKDSIESSIKYLEAVVKKVQDNL